MPKATDPLRLAQERLGPPDGWPLGCLLAQGTPAATATLLRRFEQDPHGVTGWVGQTRLASYALHLLSSGGHGQSGLASALRPGLAAEMSVVAGRKCALARLDLRAAAAGVRVLLIKGAANSQCYYTQESWRSCGDIDAVIDEAHAALLLPPAVVAARGAGRPHFTRQTWGGFGVDLHTRFGYSPYWGSLADLRAGAHPAAGFRSLDLPAPEVALTISLLHLLAHGRLRAHDLLDMTMVSRTPSFSSQAAVALWRRPGLTPLVLPGLAVLAVLIPGVYEETVLGLWAGLGSNAARQTETLLRSVTAARQTSLDRLRLRSLLTDVSLVRFGLAGFLGSLQATQSRTGLTLARPRFWVHHCVRLPWGRLRRFLRDL